MTPQAKAMAEASTFVGTLNSVFLFPLIYLLSGIAMVMFVYGAAVYIMNAESEQAREQGKKSITYGLIGLVVMASAYAILSLSAGTFGLNDEVDCAINPKGAGCDTKFKI
jgi:Type IV secretion system pilin